MKQYKKWRTYRVALIVVRHNSRVIHLDDRVPRVIDIRQFRLGRVSLGHPIDIACPKNPRESTGRREM